jgi:hypothetical protein
MKKHLKWLIVMSFCSCMKDNFDNPPAAGDPNLQANYSIKQLKDTYRISGEAVMQITNDYIISGIVTADDKSNNFYNEIVVQDTSSAIGIKIDRSNLYNDFPIGRRVFIKLKGMAVGNYNGLIQLGGYVDTISTIGVRALGSLTSSAINAVIIKGSLGHIVEPEICTITNLNDNLQYKLIKLKKIEFDCPEINATYADAIAQSDASRTLKDCNGKTIFLRNSGFSNFAGVQLPKGNGDLVAIYTVYKTDKQLKLRDVSDVKLDSIPQRCIPCSSTGGSGGGSGGGGSTAKRISIRDLRSMYTGNGITLSKLFIHGTVISDKDSKNVDSRNMVIQDSTGGLVIRFSSAHSFGIGSIVQVNFSGDSIIKYKGLMEADKIPLASAIKTGTGVIVPKALAIADIKNNMNTYESTLVKLSAVRISGGTNYYSGSASGASRQISDNATNIDLWTLSGASFANSPIPTGTRTVTGIVGIFATPQLSIRSTSDVQ